MSLHLDKIEINRRCNMNSEFLKKTDPLEKAIEIIIRSVDPDKIILFGSRARGDHKKESDYDICVIKKGVSHRRKVAQQIYRFLYGGSLTFVLIYKNNLLFKPRIRQNHTYPKSRYVLPDEPVSDHQT